MTKERKKSEENGTQVFDILGRKYTLPMFEGGSMTKERILMAATVLFARKGYDAVTMREIAQAVDIKAASLYNHFENKETLFGAILGHLKKLYVTYFEHVAQDLARAETFADKLAILFYEPKRLGNAFTSYGYSLILREQLRNDLATDNFNFFMSHGINIIKGCFDDCVACGLAPAFDTSSAAMLLLNNVFMGIMAEVQGYESLEMPYQPREMFTGMERFFLKLIDGK